MKRFLAIILSAALILSLMPSVLASDTESTVYTYNFTNTALGKAYNTDVTYATLVKDITATLDGNEWTARGLTTYQERLHDTGLTCNIKIENYATNIGAAFEIDVPEAGTYIPTATLDYATAGGIIAVRVFSETTRTEKGIVVTNGTGLENLVTIIPSDDSIRIDTYDPNSSGLKIDKAVEPKALPAVELDAGKNYVVFMIDSPNPQATSATTVQMEIIRLTLTKVLPDVPKPASVKLDSSDFTLKLGKSKTVTATVLDDNGEKLEEKVTFTSSAPGVASVNAKGTITGVAPGSATITATASNGVSASVTVTVADMYKYKFTLDQLDSEWKSANAITTRFSLDKAGTCDGDLYAHIASDADRWDILNAYGSNSLSIYAHNGTFRLARGATISPDISGIAYKLDVPKSGKYKLNYNYFENGYGLITGVWFVDKAFLAKNSITMSEATTGCRRIMALADPIIEVDTYNPDVDIDESLSSGAKVLSKGSDTVFNLEKGEYYVVFGVTGKNEAFDNKSTTLENATDAGVFSYIIYESLDLIRVGDYTESEEIIAPVKVQVYVNDPVGGAVTSSVKVGSVNELDVGSTVSVSAKETVGDYKFVGWKDSAGNFVSENTEYNFTLITKTFITAVYDKASGDSDTATVEFWNANGNLLSVKAVTIGDTFASVAKPDAEMNGYGSAIGWSVDDDTVIRGTVRAVALYNEEGAVTKGVTVNRTEIENPIYNTKITPTLSGATHWTRNGKIVAFGESFEHYIWNSANATYIMPSSGTTTVRPIVVADTNSEGYTMIEYDAADKEIVEAGILFGPEGVSLSSYVSKATVKNIKRHGQFISKPAISSLDQSVVRGYIIYRDGTEYKVAYSD